MLVAAVVHSAGINWVQTLATGATITSGVAVVAGWAGRVMTKRRIAAEARMHATVVKAVQAFAGALGVRMDDLDDRLAGHIRDHSRTRA